MFSEKLKKVIASLFIATGLILSAGFDGSSSALAQNWRNRGWHRGWDRQNRYELDRIRRLDRDRQLRYRTNNSVRTVGYYDRFGRFHAYGFYDRFGRFHRY